MMVNYTEIRTVYHGGTPFDEGVLLQRDAQKQNSGFYGYYVTTDRKVAETYGTVWSYLFKVGYSGDDVFVSREQVRPLIKATGYWENYDEIEQPGTERALDSLFSYDDTLSAIDVFFEIINTQGCEKEALDWIDGLGVTHYRDSTSIQKEVDIIINKNALTRLTCSSTEKAVVSQS